MDEPKIIPKKIALFLLLVFIIIGGYLRLSNLSRYSFWIDEFLHVYGAKGIIETGKSVLPSGLPYTRSIIYTYIVSIFFKFFGVSEVTARLPSAIFGILMIPLTYYVVSKLLNRNIGIISSSLIALSSFCTLWSNQCRMYSLFQALYLLFTFYFFNWFERNTDELQKNKFALKELTKFGFILAIYIITLSVHDFSILFIPTILTYFLFMSFFTLLKGGIKLAFNAKYFKGLVIISTMIILGIIVAKGEVNSFIKAILTPPLWSDAYNVNFYRWFFQGTYPIFSYLYPLVILMVILKKPKIGLYLSCCFLVPFTILSYVITWKAYRYLFFIFPYFIVTVSFFIEYVLYYSWKFFNKAASILALDSRIKRKNMAVFGISVLSLIFIFYPVLFPWIKFPPSKFVNFPVYNFNKIANFINSLDKNDLVICTEPLFIEYYSFKKPDFILDIKEYAGKREDYLKNNDGEDIEPVGGLKVLEELKELQSLEGTQRKVWLITSEYFLNNNLLDKEIEGHIKQTYKKHPISEDIYKVYYK